MHSAVFFRRRAPLSVNTTLKVSVWWGQGCPLRGHMHTKCVCTRSAHKCIWTNAICLSLSMWVCVYAAEVDPGEAGDSLFIWLLSGCFNSQSCSQSVAFVLPPPVVDTDASKICQKSHSLYLLGPGLGSEFDLETQTWCLSVNEKAYLKRDPGALKHTEIYRSKAFQLFLPQIYTDGFFTKAVAAVIEHLHKQMLKGCQWSSLFTHFKPFN